MRAVKISLVVLAAGLVICAGTATAQQNSTVYDAQRVGPTRPKVVSKSHQPVGTPHKASSFAPHPTTRRVFGDPIQAPIVHNTPPPKKSAPK
jgi:hypothetical protein